MALEPNVIRSKFRTAVGKRLSRIAKITIFRWNLSKWHWRLRHWVERPSYLIAVILLSALNSFLPFFPVELFLMLRVLVRPKSWLRDAVLAAVASALVMIILTQLTRDRSFEGFIGWLQHRIGASAWATVSRLVREKGWVGLFIVSVSFFPLPPAVILCALLKVPDWQVVVSIGGGHCLKYGFFSWLARRFPHRFEGEPSENNPLGKAL